jgi:hypothetical protein
MAAGTTTGSGQRERFWRMAPAALAAVVLLLPLVAMQFTSEVAWDEADFAVAGAMLFAACGTYESAARVTRSVAYRIAAGIAVLTVVILAWLNLAVGIIGSEDNPANLMFGGVLAVGIVGAFIARMQPHGMARALAATALAQATVGVVALIAGFGPVGANGPWPLVVLTGVFAALWLASAWLFRKAALEKTSSGAAPEVGSARP